MFRVPGFLSAVFIIVFPVFVDAAFNRDLFFDRLPD